MGNLYLVRHGQASFGAENYDQLSALGQRQSVRLGEHFTQLGVTFDSVIIGTLQRHQQTWQGIARGAGLNHTPLERSGLNEYDNVAVLQAVHPGPLRHPSTPEDVKQHFRLLRDGLTQWSEGKVKPVGMPTYARWVEAITDVLDHVRSQVNGNVLLVSSGGPIATAVGHVLGTSPQTSIELNLRIRNSAVTEFAFTPKRHTLVAFNSVAHLESPPYAGWITYT
jgi:broad specificity phosphatase PhoE